jgi:HEAT repeat protein
MHKNNGFRKPMTAAELMKELNQDSEFVRRRHELDKHFDSLGERLAQAEKPLVQALNDVFGVSVKSVWDLVNTAQDYEPAIPVLIAQLKYEYPFRIREGIARALTVKGAGEAAYRALVNEFEKLPDSTDAAQQGFKWALGNAISIVADRDHFDEVVDLIRDKRHGRFRDMMVSRLSDLDPNRAVDVLMELLSDDEVAGHAIVALGKLKVQRARPQLLRMTKHATPWVRKEAGKALAELDK